MALGKTFTDIVDSECKFYPYLPICIFFLNARYLNAKCSLRQLNVFVKSVHSLSNEHKAAMHCRY